MLALGQNDHRILRMDRQFDDHVQAAITTLTADRRRLNVTLLRPLRVVQEQYVDGQKLNYNDVFKSSIIGMLRSLDPHSNYYDREEYDELKTDQRSEYFGIGASIQNYFVAIRPTPISLRRSTDRRQRELDLRFGDRIVEVDGVKMTGKTSLEVRDKIRGPRGSPVKLTLERAADKRIEKVEITRDVVPQPSIPDAYMLKPGVGYIDMTRGFNYTTTDELTRGARTTAG